MSKRPRDLGPQDPELKNSPIVWEGDEESETLRESVPGGAECYFNDGAFENGAEIESGNVRLRCDRGLWVPAGPSDATKP